ncbi:MAG TPA: dTMP kinase, partial [Candidatus Sulfotelmatobacter sp.]|nr:dTMP kinase [Candidatus Sulfotelmatobacter sp.]
MSRGLFVSFEGVEGSGKSTQVALLAERLRAEGRDVLVVREPGGTPLAEEARRLFLDPATRPGPAAELFLLLVARADLLARVVRPALERGTVVLADRFDLSTRAYQIAGRGMPAGPVLEAN